MRNKIIGIRRIENYHALLASKFKITIILNGKIIAMEMIPRTDSS